MNFASLFRGKPMTAIVILLIVIALLALGIRIYPYLSPLIGQNEAILNDLK